MLFTFNANGKAVTGYFGASYVSDNVGSDLVVIERYGSMAKIPVEILFQRGMTSMAVNIFNLPVATSIDGTEYIPIVQKGITKRISVADLLGGPRATAARAPALPVVKAAADEDEAIDNAIQAARAVA